MKSVISLFFASITSDQNHRYTSWENCYLAFQNSNDKDFLSLHLAFYLASWGMYRGSSGLLQKNHKIHDKTVDVILNYKHLQCIDGRDINTKYTREIQQLILSLKEYYSNITFLKNNKEFTIAPTDTLISKILLGTLGCLPAFDRYFINGVKNENERFVNLSSNSIANLFNYYEQEEVKDKVFECQKFIREKRKIHYPSMKIIDMYFWQIGFDLNK